MSYVDNRKNLNIQNIYNPLQDRSNSNLNLINNLSDVEKNKVYLNELKKQVNKFT